MTAFEIIVVGGGPAGLVTACLFAKDGRRVALITGKRPPSGDPRTIALMIPQVRLLAHLGLWPGALKEQVAPLSRLRLVDDTGSAIKAPDLTFEPREIGEEAFGWNFPLALLIPALETKAAELGVAIIEDEVTSAKASADMIEVKTGSGEYSARLAVAADGRNSVMRAAAGIRFKTWAHDQTAIAGSFEHSVSHQGTSIEFHRSAGPFTTVPMPGFRSSFVWMERPSRVAELMALSDQQFATEIQLATHGAFGRVSSPGPRKSFPMQGLIADRFAAKRTILVGEAAHVVPPIGAQGLNMSLRDAAQAAELIAKHSDPGSNTILEEYNVMRRGDVLPRQWMIELMDRSLLSSFVIAEWTRAIGIEALANFGPLRRFVMRRGLAPQSSLPHLMQAG